MNFPYVLGHSELYISKPAPFYQYIFLFQQTNFKFVIALAFLMFRHHHHNSFKIIEQNIKQRLNLPNSCINHYVDLRV